MTSRRVAGVELAVELAPPVHVRNIPRTDEHLASHCEIFCFGCSAIAQANSKTNVARRDNRIMVVIIKVVLKKYFI